MPNNKKKLKKVLMDLTPDEREEIKRVWGKRNCSFKKDKNGYFATTHRARSKSYPTIKGIPESKVKFIESTG